MNENNITSFLAIDFGASSGRAILGVIHDQSIELKEIRRFTNPIIEVNGRLHWDLLSLYNQVIESLRDIRQQ
jgi:rhamnulokinase